MNFPESMGLGSRGPHVALLQVFLCGLGLLQASSLTGHYDQATKSAVREFQENLRLSQNGCFDASTQTAALADWGFDFDAACHLIPGTTLMIQEDGTRVSWASPAALESVSTT